MKSLSSTSFILLSVASACWLCCQCHRSNEHKSSIPGLFTIGESPSIIKIETVVALPESSVKTATIKIATMANLAKMDEEGRETRAEVARLSETASSLIGGISNLGGETLDSSLASELRVVLTRRVQSCSSACDTAIPVNHAAAIDVYLRRWQYERSVWKKMSQEPASATNDPALAENLEQSDLFIATSWLWAEMLRSCMGGYADSWLNQHAKDSGVQFTGVVKGNLVGQRQAAFEYQSPEPHFLVILWDGDSGCQMVSPQEQSEMTFSPMNAVRAKAQLQAIVGTALTSKQDTVMQGDLAPLFTSLQQRADRIANATRSLKGLIASIDSLRSCIARAAAKRGDLKSAAQNLEQQKRELKKLEDDMANLHAQREQILNAK